MNFADYKMLRDQEQGTEAVEEGVALFLFLFVTFSSNTKKLPNLQEMAGVDTAPEHRQSLQKLKIWCKTS